MKGVIKLTKKASTYSSAKFTNKVKEKKLYVGEV